jgi:hypothetical protein
MLSHTGTILVIGGLVALALSAVVLSIVTLRRGKFYHRLRPELRPRRWVLISLLFLLVVFAIWFPVWMAWPEALISHFLLGLFGVTFFVVCVAMKWLAPLVDSYVKRKGWPLR